MSTSPNPSVSLDSEEEIRRRAAAFEAQYGNNVGEFLNINQPSLDRPNEFDPDKRQEFSREYLQQIARQNAAREGLAVETDQQPRSNGLRAQEIQARAVAFARNFRQAEELRNLVGGEVQRGLENANSPQEYTVRLKTPGMGDVSVRLDAGDVSAATREAWSVIEEHDGLSAGALKSAQLEWEADQQPQVSYLYDREQGFEWDRPPGIKLTAERDLLVNQTINEAQENGALKVEADQTVISQETNEVVANPTDNEIKSALAARTALEKERQSILAEAQTPHEPGLDGALKSYVNGRVDAYNNIRNAMAESSAIELPEVIEPEEIAVVAPTLEIDDRQQSLELAL
jgi:hypothetical protein